MSEIAVVIPSFNSTPFLGECLRSVLAQDFAAWEAVVIDDCSTDGDPAAVVAALGDPRIRCVRHGQNRGLAAARNTGFRETSAPLVLPLDADDLLAPTCLREMRAAFEKEPATDCVFGDFELFGAESGRREYRAEPLAALTRQQWLPGAGVLMRRAVWEGAGGYCEDAALRAGNEDWDFWLAAAARGFSAVHLPRALYRYRQHTTSMTITLRAIDHETRHFMHRRHHAFFARHGGARRFVADGYWRAAWAARELGRPVPALLRSAQAVALDGDFPRFRNGVRTIGRAMLARLWKMPARTA